MRGKRSKAYRRVLKQFSLAFGFREPWQVLVDADLIKDAHRFAIDLPQYLANTLHGEVKILVTQCSMRHLYADNSTGGAPLERVIDKAKGFERRRCGHHPEQYPQPLSTAECLASVVGPTNKHRYVVASQEYEVRAQFRQIPGVPLVYISRSVMILEPMAHATTKVVNKGERAKFRAELKEPAAKAGEKRKRDEDHSEGSDDDDEADAAAKKKAAAEQKKKKKRKGEKGPNPLAVKKAKKQTQDAKPARPKPQETKTDEPAEQPAKKKRKRKTKRAEDEGEQGAGVKAPEVVDADGED